MAITLDASALIDVKEFQVFDNKDADADIDNKEHFYVHLNAASSAIKNHCRRLLCPTTDVSEQFDGTGDQRYRALDHKINADPVLYRWDGSAWVVMSVTDYPRDYDGDTGEVWLTTGGKFVVGYRNYKIDYNAGWDRANVPFDLKSVCFSWVKRSIMRAEQNKVGITSESFGEVSTSYNLHKIPDDFLFTLSEYRRESIG